MNHQQARDLQAEMARLAETAEPDNLRMVAMTLAEVLAHVASALEARTPSKKRG